MTTTDTGLEFISLEEGTGESPQQGDTVSVHYVGALEDGTVFDTSYKRGQPLQFMLGVGQVIAGWDEGIGLMKKGGKAKLIIPPNLGYGSRGAGGAIPPNATLHFEVELVDFQAPARPQTIAEEDYTTTSSGLKYHDFEEGSGRSPKKGQEVAVHYTGWLTNGKKFDSSHDRNQPLEFPVGVGRVIAGWDEGVLSMKEGGKRQLVIPPKLGYGKQGAGQVIPPDSTLVFEVELVKVKS